MKHLLIMKVIRTESTSRRVNLLALSLFVLIPSAFAFAWYGQSPRVLQITQEVIVDLQGVGADPLVIPEEPVAGYLDVALSGNIVLPDGTNYNGGIYVGLRQEINGIDGGFTSARWGPVYVDVLDGSFSETIGLENTYKGVAVEIIFSVDERQSIAKEGILFDNAIDGRRGIAVYQLPLSWASSVLQVSLVDDVQLYDPPCVGSLDQAGGPPSGVVVRIASGDLQDKHDRFVRESVLYEPGSGLPLFMYGWLDTNESVMSFAYEDGLGGIGVIKTMSVGAAHIESYKELSRVKLEIDLTDYPSLDRFILIPSDDYSTYEIDPIASSLQSSFRTQFRLNNAGTQWSQPNAILGGSLIGEEGTGQVWFMSVPVGLYVLECWSRADVTQHQPSVLMPVNVLGTNATTVPVHHAVFASFCDPADANATGLSCILNGVMGSGFGSNLHLEATQGVPGLIGYFLIGTGISDPGIPISQGHLCLATGVDLFGRYNVFGGSLNSVGAFDANGVLQNYSNTSSVGSGYDVPLEIPPPIGGIILSGSQWNFQLWYRDGQTGNSNFSNGLTVLFP